LSHLASQGIREVTLLGQNVNGYRGTFHDGDICSFAELLKHIADIEGIGRIRFTTSHPLEFNDDLIEAICRKLPNSSLMYIYLCNQAQMRY
jgi:tRNA-2-methylthio-N6-dimethylallyladenosine synthase